MQNMFVIHYYIDKQILDSYLHTKSEKIWLLFTFVRNFKMAAVATEKCEKFKVLGIE
jgi:hypothetical protein